MSIAARNAILAGGAALPYDAEVEYLQRSSNTLCYIDTEIYAFTKGSFTIDVEISGDGFERFIGAGNTRKTDPVVGIGAPNSGNNMFPYRYGSQWNDANVTTVNISQRNTILFSFEPGKQTLRVNDVLHKQSSFTAFTGGTTIWLFATNQPNYATWTKRTVKIRKCIIDNDGVLVRDFIPVRVGSGAEAVGYMYDRVSGELFGNAGTGAFVIGPDK